MKKELIKILDEEFQGREPKIKDILEIENDSRIQNILSEIFSDVDEISVSELNKLTRCKFVMNLLFDYVDENLKLKHEESIDFPDDMIDLTDMYIREVSQYPILTTKQEYKYGKLLKEGSKEEKQMARDVFINHNQKLVIKMASKYTGRGMEFMDIVGEGNRGLIEAIKKFDVDYENKFSTYAIWWIRQAITRGIADKSRTIRIPVHASESLLAINRYETKFIQEFNHDPSDRELAIYMYNEYNFSALNKKIEVDLKGCPNIDEEKRDYYEKMYNNYSRQEISEIPLVKGKYNPKRIVRLDDCFYDLNFKTDLYLYQVDYIEKIITTTRKNTSKVVSLDAAVKSGDDDSSTLGEFVKDDKETANIELQYEDDALKRLVIEMLDMVDLDPREKEVIRLRFGLSLIEPKTIEEICMILYGFGYDGEKYGKVESDIGTIEEKLRQNPDELDNIIHGDESSLSMYERELIVLKYGITSSQAYTLEEVSNVFGITRERVRQIEAKAIKKIQRNRVALQKIKGYTK